MSPSLATDLGPRIDAVRERITLACQRAGRPANGVTLIAVSKTWPLEAVVAALNSGVTEFGENRVQEALEKIDSIGSQLASTTAKPVWHLIGHLQTNKVKFISGRFAILHGIDSERLIESVGHMAEEPQRVMLEVNVSGEPSKFGVHPGDVGRALEAAAATSGVFVTGLMTVAPQSNDAECARPVFRELRRLAERHSLPDLSMGMTNDFEVAIEEGATHVRVGRAIFGERA